MYSMYLVNKGIILWMKSLMETSRKENRLVPLARFPVMSSPFPSLHFWTKSIAHSLSEHYKHRFPLSSAAPVARMAAWVARWRRVQLRPVVIVQDTPTQITWLTLTSGEWASPVGVSCTEVGMCCTVEVCFVQATGCRWTHLGLLCHGIFCLRGQSENTMQEWC